jgi:hypothetical protein
VMSKERPEILLKTDTKTIMSELGREGKFSAKATGWDEKIEISAVHGPWLIVKVQAPSAGSAAEVPLKSAAPVTRRRGHNPSPDCNKRRMADAKLSSQYRSAR